MKTLMIALGIIASFTLTAQVAINNDGTTPDPSAMLEVKSTNKGFLPPRMTTAQIDSISYPAEGLIVYNTDNETLMVFNGVLWKSPIAGFVCGDQIMDSDSNIYNTVIIGMQPLTPMACAPQDGTHQQISNGLL